MDLRIHNDLAFYPHIEEDGWEELDDSERALLGSVILDNFLLSLTNWSDENQANDARRMLDNNNIPTCIRKGVKLGSILDLKTPSFVVPDESIVPPILKRTFTPKPGLYFKPDPEKEGIAELNFASRYCLAVSQGLVLFDSAEYWENKNKPMEEFLPWATEKTEQLDSCWVPTHSNVGYTIPRLPLYGERLQQVKVLIPAELSQGSRVQDVFDDIDYRDMHGSRRSVRGKVIAEVFSDEAKHFDGSEPREGIWIVDSRQLMAFCIAAENIWVRVLNLGSLRIDKETVLHNLNTHECISGIRIDARAGDVVIDNPEWVGYENIRTLER